MFVERLGFFTLLSFTLGLQYVQTDWQHLKPDLPANNSQLVGLL